MIQVLIPENKLLVDSPRVELRSLLVPLNRHDFVFVAESVSLDRHGHGVEEGESLPITASDQVLIGLELNILYFAIPEVLVAESVFHPHVVNVDLSIRLTNAHCVSLEIHASSERLRSHQVLRDHLVSFNVDEFQERVLVFYSHGHHFVWMQGVFF